MPKTPDSTTMEDIGRSIKLRLPGLGYALLVFPLDRSGNISFTTNARRDDMIAAFRKAADVLEADANAKRPFQLFKPNR